MTPSMVGKDAGTARAGEYAQHRPEQTLLYQLIEAHYPLPGVRRTSGSA